jgi:hypothetical protein
VKKLTVLLSVAVVVALVLAGVAGMFTSGSTPSVYASRLAGIRAAGATGIQIQNLDKTQAATVVADFYKQGATSGPIGINVPSIQPLSAGNIYLPNESKLTNGAYAAIISGDRQLAAIARTEWAASGGAALYSNVAPATNVALPLAVKNYFSQSSLISIQNTDPNAQASVTIKLYQVGATTPTLQKTYTIEKGTSITLDMGTNPDFDLVPNNFLGSMAVESATQVGVQSFVDFSNSEKAVYAFEGVPSEQAADTLYTPLVRNNFPNNATGATTGVSVVNPGTTAVQVSMDYAGSPPSGCAGQNFSDGPVTIAAGSSHVFYHGAGTNLPKGCLAAGTIKATGGKVLAIVNDASGNPGNPTTSAAYNAVSVDQGAKDVALPLYRNEHLTMKLTTGIQAMNISSTASRASISFTLFDGTSIPTSSCQPDCTQTIQPGGSYTWYPPSITSLQKGKFGSAFITSEQPLAVIVNDASLTGAMDAAIYNGIKADAQ